MNGSIFQNFPKFEPKIGSNLRIFLKKSAILLKILGKFGPKLGRLVYKWVTFSLKIGICMGLLSNFAAAHPYQNQS